MQVGFAGARQGARRDGSSPLYRSGRPPDCDDGFEYRSLDGAGRWCAQLCPTPTVGKPAVVESMTSGRFVGQLCDTEYHLQRAVLRCRFEHEAPDCEDGFLEQFCSQVGHDEYWRLDGTGRWCAQRCPTPTVGKPTTVASITACRFVGTYAIRSTIGAEPFCAIGLSTRLLTRTRKIMTTCSPAALPFA